jgi:hypothetical protein
MVDGPQATVVHVCAVADAKLGVMLASDVNRRAFGRCFVRFDTASDDDRPSEPAPARDALGPTPNVDDGDNARPDIDGHERHGHKHEAREPEVAEDLVFVEQRRLPREGDREHRPRRDEEAHRVPTERKRAHAIAVARLRLKHEEDQCDR